MRRNVLKGRLVQINEGILPMNPPVRYTSERTENLGEIIVIPSLIRGGKCRELLTGIEFDSLFLTFGSDLRYSRSKNIDTAVDIKWYLPVTMEQLKEYFEKHKHVEEYRRQLLAIKEAGKMKAEASIRKEQERKTQNKMLIKERNNFIKQISYR